MCWVDSGRSAQAPKRHVKSCTSHARRAFCLLLLSLFILASQDSVSHALPSAYPHHRIQMLTSTAPGALAVAAPVIVAACYSYSFLLQVLYRHHNNIIFDR